MENKIGTPLDNAFSTEEKTILQRDNQSLRSTAEMIVINFDQEKFEKLLSLGGKSPLSCASTKKSSWPKLMWLTLSRQPLSRINKLSTSLS